MADPAGLDFKALTSWGIEALAQERRARAFLWVVVPEDGPAFGGCSPSLGQYGPALMTEVERAAARPLIVWSPIEGQLQPSSCVLAHVKHVDLHPLVAALIVGVNKLNNYKVPRTQATAENMPPWFPLPFERYCKRAQAYNLLELFSVLDAIFAHIRFGPEKIAKLRTEADVHFYKNNTNISTRTAVYAYFEFLASELAGVNAPPLSAGFVPQPPVAFQGDPSTSSSAGDPPPLAVDSRIGGELSTPVGSLASSPSVTQLPPRNGTSPALSASNPFEVEEYGALEDIVNLNHERGQSLGSLESEDFGGGGGTDEWSQQGEPIENYLMDWEMEDVGGNTEDNPADVTGRFPDVSGGGSVGRGFPEGGRGFDDVSGGGAGVSGLQANVTGRTTRGGADVSVEMGEDPYGLRGECSEQAGSPFYEDPLRLFPASVSATSPEAVSVLRSLAEGKAPSKLGAGYSPGPLTQKLKSWGQGLGSDEVSEGGLLTGKVGKGSKAGGEFFKDGVSKKRVLSGVTSEKAPRGKSSLAELDPLMAKLEAVSLGCEPGAFRPETEGGTAAFFPHRASFNSSDTSTEAESFCGSEGSVAESRVGGKTRNRGESGVRLLRRMQELEKRLGEAEKRAEGRRRQLEESARVLSEPVSPANADVILDVIQSEVVVEACARTGGTAREELQTVAENARRALVQALCADGLSVDTRATAAVLLGSFCGADAAAAARALASDGVIEGLVKLACAQDSATSPQTLSEGHAVARRVLFQLAGCMPRGIARLRNSHVVDLLLRLVSTPDASSDGPKFSPSVSGKQPGSVYTRGSQPEAVGDNQPGTSQSLLRAGRSVGQKGEAKTDAGENPAVLDLGLSSAGLEAQTQLGARLGALKALTWLAGNAQQAPALIDANALDALIPLLRANTERNELLEPLVTCLWHLTRSGYKPEQVAKRMCSAGGAETVTGLVARAESAQGTCQDGTERIGAVGVVRALACGAKTVLVSGSNGSVSPDVADGSEALAEPGAGQNGTESLPRTEVRNAPTGLDLILSLLEVLVGSVQKEGVDIWSTIAPLVGVIVNVSTWAPESRTLIIRRRPDGVAVLLNVLRTAQDADAATADARKGLDRTIRYVAMVLNALAQERASGLRVVEQAGVDLLVRALQSKAPGVARESTLAMGALLHTCKGATREALSRGGWEGKGIPLPWSIGSGEGGKAAEDEVEILKRGVKGAGEEGRDRRSVAQEDESRPTESGGSGSPRSVLTPTPLERSVSRWSSGNSRAKGSLGLHKEGPDEPLVEALG